MAGRVVRGSGLWPRPSSPRMGRSFDDSGAGTWIGIDYGSLRLDLGSSAGAWIFQCDDVCAAVSAGAVLARNGAAGRLIVLVLVLRPRARNSLLCLSTPRTRTRTK